uniref:YqaJ viral recombinase domain-containing protein n=1 Tax=viral metagenome TaxID=1070528 RepID=A0A6C0E1J8_9ZZZZ
MTDIDVVSCYENKKEPTESETEEELELTIYELLEEYIDGDQILKLSAPTFHEEMTDDITHILFQSLNDAGVWDEEDYDWLYTIVETYTRLWFQSWICPERHMSQYKGDYHAVEMRVDRTLLADQMQYLREKNDSNPLQRTKEWYERRSQMMTASNLWQTLGSDAQKNRFIYDKCRPLEVVAEDRKWVSTENSLHWGVKYEPLSVMVYEKITGAKVESLGCIQHPKYPFLGASPDGIVGNEESPLYGRLVEIKNIYNREMDGIPSEAYWIQIQGQLACCGLALCDFVETRFKEYSSAEEYYEETDMERMRGIILYFVPRDGMSNTPLYRYMPLMSHPTTDPPVNLWMENTIKELEETHVLFHPIYWYLDDIQMSSVAYNDIWFSHAVKRFKETWDTIEKERTTGYEHRSPKKRALPLPEKNKVCIIKLTENETIQIETECI